MATTTVTLPRTIPLGVVAGGGSRLVLNTYDAAIGGFPFMVDDKHEAWGWQTIPLLKEQQDTSDVPAEHSLSTESLWRQAQESWHEGAGQTYMDRPESSVFRFRSSKGTDGFTNKWELTLLKDTANKGATTETNLLLVRAGARLYRTNGNKLQYTLDQTVASPTWTDVTGVPINNPNGLASNGFHIWTPHGASGLYQTDRTSGATAQGVTGTLDGPLGWVKQRLMAASGNKIYNIVTINTTTPPALPTASYEHPNIDFAWVGFAEGLNRIYAAGFSGDKSEVFRLALKADGTGLDAAIPATPGLPDGEVVRGIGNYLGFVALGTDKGLRFCEPNDVGDLNVGALIPTLNPVRAFEGQDRFLWYGLENYDAVSTGLGRLNLRHFTDTLTPAYASDLMATAQGQVSSIVTFKGVRVFAVQGVGVFSESVTDYVASGTIDSGLITFGLPDRKITHFFDVRHKPLAGTVAASLSADESSTFTALGTTSLVGSKGMEFPTQQERAEVFETRLTLSRASGDATAKPTVTRTTLKGDPVGDAGRIFVVPLLFHEFVTTNQKTRRSFDIRRAQDFLIALRNEGSLTTYQVGDQLLTVKVKDLRFEPIKRAEDKKEWEGTMVVQLKEVR